MRGCLLMMSSTAGGFALLFSRLAVGMVQTPSRTSSQRMVATLSLRCAVSNSSLSNAPNVTDRPQHPDLIVAEGALATVGIVTIHAGDDHRHVVAVPCGVPVHHLAKIASALSALNAPQNDGDGNIRIVPSPSREINRDYRIIQGSNPSVRHDTRVSASSFLKTRSRSSNSPPTINRPLPSDLRKLDGMDVARQVRMLSKILGNRKHG